MSFPFFLKFGKLLDYLKNGGFEITLEPINLLEKSSGGNASQELDSQKIPLLDLHRISIQSVVGRSFVSHNFTKLCRIVIRTMGEWSCMVSEVERLNEGELGVTEYREAVEMKRPDNRFVEIQQEHKVLQLKESS